MKLEIKVSFRNRLFAVLVLLIIIPVFSNSVFLYQKNLEIIEEKSKEYARNLTVQINTTVDTYLKQVDKLSTEAGYSDLMTEVLGKDYSDSPSPVLEYGNDRRTASRYLIRMVRMVEGVESVFVYNNYGKDYYTYISGINNPNYSLKHESWYEEFISGPKYRIFIGPHKQGQLDITNEVVVSVVRKIRDLKTLKINGIIVVDVNVNVFSDLIKSINSADLDSKTYLIDSQGGIIFSNQDGRLPDVLIDKVLSNSKASGIGVLEEEIDGEKVLVTFNTSGFSGWHIVNLLSKSQLVKKAEVLKSSWILIGVLLLLVLFATALLISRGMTKPIGKLEKAIEQIRSGGLGSIIEWNNNDEFGPLINSFNAMSVRLKELVEQIYIQEQEKRKAEIMVLTNQINPHFIYNTLNTVKYMAIIQKNRGIAEIVEALMTVLNASLRNRNRFITIKEELEVLKLYIFIQETRYCEKFHITYDIEDEITECKTLDFILQPIVENAIFHGVEPKKGTGNIAIIGRRINDTIEFLVEDNGVGMDSEKVKEVMDENQERERIGIINVHKRIKLYFGEKYGLEIESIKEVGTRVHICIPVLE